MNSKKVIAAVMTAALSTASVAVYASAADPVATGFNVTKASALGGNGTYINASESGSVAPGASDGDGGVNGSVKVNGNTVEITPAYSCYGAENGEGKAPTRISVVTDIDYSGDFTATYDSQIKKAIFSNEGGKLKIEFNVNAAAYGSTASLKFQDADKFYELNVKNNGFKSDPVATASIEGLDGVKVTSNGTEIVLEIPDGISISEFQQATYTVKVNITLGDKEFEATSAPRFLAYIGKNGKEIEVSGFSTKGQDSIAADDVESIVYANNYVQKVTLKRNEIVGEPPVDTSEPPVPPTSDVESGSDSKTDNNGNDGVNSDTPTNDGKGDNTTNNNNNGGTTNGNPNTGVALAIAPVVLAAGSVVAVSVIKKRK